MDPDCLRVLSNSARMPTFASSCTRHICDLVRVLSGLHKGGYDLELLWTGILGHVVLPFNELNSGIVSHWLWLCAALGKLVSNWMWSSTWGDDVAPQNMEKLSTVHYELNFQELLVDGFGPMCPLKSFCLNRERKPSPQVWWTRSSLARACY